MNRCISVLEEPKIVFGDGRLMTDPHAGLSLFGPYDKDDALHPASVTYAVIGTEHGVRAFRDFVQLMQGPLFLESVHNQADSSENNRLWPPFPGFSAAFYSQLPKTTKFEHIVPRSAIDRCVHDRDQHKRVFDIANLYLDKIRLIAERDEGIKVIVCVEPDIVWANCRQQSIVRDNATGEKVSKHEVILRRLYGGDLFSTIPDGQYEFSTDFRRHIKARSMEYGIPIQLIRESTLNQKPDRGEREVTPLSDRAWNLATALFYKAGGKPWKLAGARDGVCYVGLAFKQEERRTKKTRTACCAAQMFLDTGDGVVFRGEYGPWYSLEKHEFHLSKKAATFLLDGVLKTYAEQEGRPLKEVFLHSRSGFNDEELAGYKEACGDNIKLVGIRVGSRGFQDLRLFRNGDWCVRRGSTWIFDDRTAYLWASGFKTDLLSYDGWEVPVPIQIRVQYGSADIMQVVQDILGLTKLNYNACKIGDALPVTVAFSDRVGEILVSNPTIKKRYPNFKFYI